MPKTTEPPPAQLRRRKPGGGRKRKLESMTGLSRCIEHLLEYEPMAQAALYWTYRGMAVLAAESRRQGFDVSRRVLADYFAQNDFRMTHNRKLPAQFSPADVDTQFRIIGRSIRSQWEQRRDVLFLEGAKVQIADVLRKQGHSMPPQNNGYSFTENVFHYCPPDIACLSEEVEIVVLRGLNGEVINPLAPRLLSPEERETIRRRKREATILPLKDLITDRNPAIFTAILLRHWFEISTPYPTKPVVLVTHGTSPDTISPDNWKWALNRLRIDTGTPIIVRRIPPATWRYTGAMHRLFSFTAQECPEQAINGYTITAWVVPFDSLPRNEIETIPAVLDFRRFPKSRKVTKRMRERMSIQRYAPYNVWNYSFGVEEKADD